MTRFWAATAPGRSPPSGATTARAASSARSARRDRLGFKTDTNFLRWSLELGNRTDPSTAIRILRRRVSLARMSRQKGRVSIVHDAETAGGVSETHPCLTLSYSLPTIAVRRCRDKD